MSYSYLECEHLYQTQFSSMSLTEEGMRYLKVRSLIDREPLTNSPSLRQWLGIQRQRFSRQIIEQLRIQVFDNDGISLEDLDNQLRVSYKEIQAARNWNIPKLKNSLWKISRTGDKYWRAWNSVYRDDIRAHIQHHFVRTPEIQDYVELVRRIDKDLDPVVKGYTVISWYNQWTSALIEHMILSHPRVVPAARRIDKVDFFFVGVPIDLKVTFLPQGYLAHLRRHALVRDTFTAISHLENHPLELAKWLYENQGESRFSDSHRLFIILVDEHNLEQSWKLKSDFPRIKKAIDSYLIDTQQLKLLQWSFQGRRISGTFTTYVGLLVVKRQ